MFDQLYKNLELEGMKLHSKQHPFSGEWTTIVRDIDTKSVMARASHPSKCEAELAALKAYFKL